MENYGTSASTCSSEKGKSNCLQNRRLPHRVHLPVIRERIKTLQAQSDERLQAWVAAKHYADSLRVALDALDTLQAQGRKVGVISHVQEMTERIGVRIQVKRQSGGQSRVAVVSM